MEYPVFIILLLLHFITCGNSKEDSLSMKGMTTTDNPTICPDESDIKPCTCIVDITNSLILDCSKVADEDELTQVFKSYFPQPNFKTFLMRENKKVKHLTSNIFGDVSFKVISMQKGGLKHVSYHTFNNSFETLEYLDLSSNHLADIPWFGLHNYTSLNGLHLASNNITSVPSFYCKTLSEIYLGNNSLTGLQTDVFQHLKHLEHFEMDLAGLTDIVQGTFADMSHLFSIHLFYNDLTHVPEGTFATSSKKLQYIYLSYNKITTVEPDAFPALPLLEVWLRDNQLVDVEEVVWRPLLEAGGFLRVKGNPLLCGCDVAWLVRNQTLMSMVDDAACENSDSSLYSLDPEDYKDC
ncbi:unnamed protein product [Meganyctiphanes norvegica]|uniref:Uncharacterized protein n=1 Tax=Meganyctiphanes norvegica TaxID=48144 RepID=A0AAV2RNZ2_MEGNR